MLWTLLAVAIILLLSRLYTILPRTGRRKGTRQSTNCTVAVFLGSGGHTAEALTLLSALDTRRYNRRIYLISDGDDLSVRKAVDLETRHFKARPSDYTFVHVPRARKVHQTLLTTPFSAAYSLLFCFHHLTIRPVYNRRASKFADVLILNGPGTCFVLCLAVYINKLLGLEAPSIIYVESFARVKSLSLSGKLMRPFADRFITQWPNSHERLNSDKWLV